MAQPKVHRTWLTLLTASLSMFILGAIYAYGVLLPAVMQYFAWDRSTAAVPQSVLLFVYAVGMSVGGALQDRTSPTRIAIAGGALFGIAILTASFTNGLLPLTLSYGLAGGIGFGFAYVAAVTAAMKSLPDRRGLAAGIVVGAFGLGAFIWAPLAQGLLATADWQVVLRRYGLLAAIGLPLLGIGVRAPWHPHDVPGYHPDQAGVTLGTALRSSVFWLVFIAYTLVTAVGLFLLAHLVNYAIAQGIPALRAALILSVTAIGSGLGRVLMGWLSDRIGRFPSLIGTSLLAVALLALLAIGVSPLMIFIIAGLSGFSFGTWLSLYGPTSIDLFGLRAAGAIYGVLYLSYGLGGLLGPTVGGLIADWSGGYGIAFLASAILCAVAATLYLVAKRREPPRYPRPPALEEEWPV